MPSWFTESDIPKDLHEIVEGKLWPKEIAEVLDIAIDEGLVIHPKTHKKILGDAVRNATAKVNGERSEAVATLNMIENLLPDIERTVALASDDDLEGSDLSAYHLKVIRELITKATNHSRPQGESNQPP